MTDAPDPLIITLQEDWSAKAVAEKHLQAAVQAFVAEYERLKADCATKAARIAELENPTKPVAEPTAEQPPP